MLNRVLWTLDNELTGVQFERLCTDLLFRSGYRDIVPIEAQDGGRDAEERPASGRGRFGELCFLQFSLESDWKAKLRRDMRRVHDGGHRPSRFVFVTSRTARGIDSDVIAREAVKLYGWDLTVYSREWLRLQLEEGHPDLAHKYLGVENAGPPIHRRQPYPGSPLEGDALAQVRALFEAGAFERAAVELRDLAAHDVGNPALWEALAWSQYQTYRYDEAVGSINRALDILASPQADSIRGCILAERAIERNDRASLLEAKEIFLRAVTQDGRGSWEDFYNLGNVLTALGQHDAAVLHYRRAAELAPGVVEIWKNLASSYHLTGDHDKEMECFDRALTLDPLKPEALASKGVSLLVDFGQADDAALHLEKAISVDGSWGARWPHVWYWLAEAYTRSGRQAEALRSVDAGLRHQPGHRALRRQKSDLLAELIEVDLEHLTAAERFWESALELEPRDFNVRRRLVRVKLKRGEELAAWALLDECFAVFEMPGMPSMVGSGFSLEDVVDSFEALPMYCRFRVYRPLAVYWDGEEELYDLAFEPPRTATIEPLLEAYLMVPFGQMVRELQRLVDGGAMAERIGGVLRAHAAGITSVVTEASRELASLIPSDVSAEEKSGPIADIVLFLGLLGLREFSAQLGFVAAFIGVPPDPFQTVLDDFPYSELEADIVSGCIQPLNDEAHFAPE